MITFSDLSLTVAPVVTSIAKKEAKIVCQASDICRTLT